jgi:cysteine-rich repeat protein
MRGLVTIVVAAVVAVVHSSCFFDTKSTLCASSGLRCPPGWVCSADQDACIEVGACGDRVISGEEVCDDGNRADGDGCSADCTSDESCGNGKLDASRGEFCDDGNRLDGDGCSASCTAEMCGNFVLDAKFGEVCDDGNGESGDGCSADCRSNEACGNNVIDAHLGEQCEFADAPFPAPVFNTVTCDSDCTFPMCGDGHLNREYDLSPQGDREQCDTAGDSESCDSDCTFVKCGDGYPNMAAGEQCDTGDPNMNTADCNGQTCKTSACPDFIHNPQAGEACDTGGNSQACDSDCTIPACGDFHKNEKFTPDGASSPEDCDEGGVDTMTCDFDCSARRCGDGYQNTTAGELCDDGDGDNHDACPDGAGGTCEPARCGDGHVRTNVEACDTGGDSAICDSDCTLPVCGDGHKNTAAGEQCDGGGCTGGLQCIGCMCM